MPPGAGTLRRLRTFGARPQFHRIGQDARSKTASARQFLTTWGIGEELIHTVRIEIDRKKPMRARLDSFCLWDVGLSLGASLYANIVVPLISTSVTCDLRRY